MSDEPETAEVSVSDIYADLGGVHEISEALGVSTFRLNRWIERRASTKCPEPVRKLRGIHIYSISDWTGWFALWRVTRGCETWKRRKGQENT